jgi:inner membrane protein
MDNLTHSLIGLAAAKAGLERLSPATSAVCLLAANAPDSDIVSAFIGDRWTYLHHHRGITHSIIGTLTLSLLIPIIFVLGDRVLARVRGRAPSIRARGLILASLIVGATHPIMDWTNNYGIRPYLPWNPRWYYGDMVFIVDPFIWFFVGGAVFLLTANSRKQVLFWLGLAAIVSYIVFFGAAGRPGVGNIAWVQLIWVGEIILLTILYHLKLGARWGNRLALGAFAVLILYWGGLAGLHHLALERSRDEAKELASKYAETVVDVAAMPTLADPFHWQSVVETERAAYRFDMFLFRRSGTVEIVRHERPEAHKSPIVEEALNTRPARIFLEFARFPVLRVEGMDCTTQTFVQLADLRYTEPGNTRGVFGLNIPVECDTQQELKALK